MEPDRARKLDENTYNAAYTAWAIARDDAFAEWQKSTDPNYLKGKVPKAFIDASKFVQDNQKLLRVDVHSVIRKLNSVPTHKANKAMRRALRDAIDDQSRIESIVRVLDKFGIQEAKKVEPLPVIEIGDIRLVAWMAVQKQE